MAHVIKNENISLLIEKHRTATMKLFAKIVKGCYPLTIFHKLDRRYLVES